MAASDRRRILLVDDDVFSSPVLEKRLKAHGYCVTLFNGIVDAERALDCEDIDLILSDIHMPGNNRLEWTEALLNRPGTAPVLLMTGNPAMETACSAANLPVAGYLIKPPDWPVLDQRIQQAIGTRHRRADFVGLAREILSLVEHSSNGPQDEVLLQRLASLAASFLAGVGRADTAACLTTVDFRWRAALADAVTVIEKTRHSFRSKELGQLRSRLEQLLCEHATRDHGKKARSPQSLQ